MKQTKKLQRRKIHRISNSPIEIQKSYFETCCKKPQRQEVHTNCTYCGAYTHHHDKLNLNRDFAVCEKRYIKQNKKKKTLKTKRDSVVDNHTFVIFRKYRFRIVSLKLMCVRFVQTGG